MNFIIYLGSTKKNKVWTYGSKNTLQNILGICMLSQSVAENLAEEKGLSIDSAIDYISQSVVNAYRLQKKHQ